tara:strand:- start:122 stop:271 length:150 start_codon:yes stop_codon:yes gene_type:complete
MKFLVNNDWTKIKKSEKGELVIKTSDGCGNWSQVITLNEQEIKVIKNNF